MEVKKKEEEEVEEVEEVEEGKMVEGTASSDSSSSESEERCVCGVCGEWRGRGKREWGEGEGEGEGTASSDSSSSESEERCVWYMVCVCVGRGGGGTTQYSCIGCIIASFPGLGTRLKVVYTNYHFFIGVGIHVDIFSQALTNTSCVQSCIVGCVLRLNQCCIHLIDVASFPTHSTNQA